MRRDDSLVITAVSAVQVLCVNYDAMCCVCRYLSGLVR